MKILGIETSCDETAFAALEAEGGLETPLFRILETSLFSQAELHAPYGGVYPNLAKREHAKNAGPLLLSLIEKMGKTPSPITIKEDALTILNREPELQDYIRNHADSLGNPGFDIITVTQGPGLEPALWVGINLAKCLGILWGIPVIPTNHMEGHLVSPLLHDSGPITFPALGVLISGGHTQLIKLVSWGSYSVIGDTKDDAIGEAFDKVARILGLPYPGGPQISHCAQRAREKNIQLQERLPRPMIKSGDAQFSFSGLKTAVLYLVQRKGILSQDDICMIAREFEDSVADVLMKKTTDALHSTNACTLILGGGVVANTFLRETFKNIAEAHNIALKIAEPSVATDNAAMIAAAGYISYLKNPYPSFDFEAEGNKSL